MNAGRVMLLRPGQLVGAVSWLAERWNWTPKACRIFLDALEAEGMIRFSYGDEDAPTAKGKQDNFSTDHQGTNKGKHRGKLARIITLCNFSLYQHLPIQEGQTEGQGEGQIRGKQTPKKGQQYKEEQGNKETREETLETSSLDQPLSETEVSDGVGSASSSRSRHPYSPAFEDFWSEYPDTRGMSKSRAWARWQKLSPDERRDAHSALPAFKAQIAKRRELSPETSTLHAEGYLNQRRFETLVEIDRPAAGAWWRNPDKVQSMTVDRWRRGIAQFANGIWPVDKLGPPPGHPQCVVPKDLLAELRLTEKYDAEGISRDGCGHEH